MSFAPSADQLLLRDPAQAEVPPLSFSAASHSPLLLLAGGCDRFARASDGDVSRSTDAQLSPGKTVNVNAVQA
jgi:hypothetical protein